MTILSSFTNISFYLDNEDEVILAPGESGEATIEEKDGLKKITEVNWSEELGKHIKVWHEYCFIYMHLSHVK